MQQRRLETPEMVDPAGRGGPDGEGRVAALEDGRVFSHERRLATRLLNALGRPPLALVLWNGEEIGAGSGPAETRLRIRDRGSFYRLLARPDLQFGELYSAGRLEVEGDLVRFLEIVYRSRLAGGGRGVPGRLAGWLRGAPRAQTLARSRRNIHHHYDIGNQFYQLWLDSAAMQYTCAYFPLASLSLEEAQRAKLRHVCRKLELRPGDSVVEAGSGWGGLACHMAREHGVTVRAFNTSHEQVAHSRERALHEGLAGRVEFVEDDYRNIRGEYDVFVSVGMLEHVGPANYAELGEVIHRCLKPRGRGLLHSIGRNRPAPLNSWIRKRIFPGAHPPTLGEMAEIFEPRAFSVLDVENLRLHYARTLEHWLERYERQAERVREMFDERFVRAWRLYLAGSVAAFRTGTLQLFQVLFTRPDNNDLAWSRAHLYDAD
jgi:cyclopropane-fatty-acyl-phospholipid synthase